MDKKTWGRNKGEDIDMKYKDLKHYCNTHQWASRIENQEKDFSYIFRYGFHRLPEDFCHHQYHTECLIYQYGMPPNLTPLQGTNFIAKVA